MVLLRFIPTLMTETEVVKLPLFSSNPHTHNIDHNFENKVLAVSGQNGYKLLSFSQKKLPKTGG